MSATEELSSRVKEREIKQEFNWLNVMKDALFKFKTTLFIPKEKKTFQNKLKSGLSIWVDWIQIRGSDAENQKQCLTTLKYGQYFINMLVMCGASLH